MYFIYKAYVFGKYVEHCGVYGDSGYAASQFVFDFKFHKLVETSVYCSRIIVMLCNLTTWFNCQRGFRID